MVFDLAHYQNLVAVVDAAATATEKGDAFEELIAYLLENLEGVKVWERDKLMASEEIDLVLWNAQIEEVLRPWEAVILVECKNWSAAVGAPSLDSFIGKLRRRNLKTGLFVAANGVTGGFIRGDGIEAGAVGLLQSALQEGIRVVVLRGEDLRAITSIDGLRHLIQDRYMKLYVHRLF
jgi:hypothetical protein